MKKLVIHPAFHLTLLIAVTLLCYGRTLGSYFLADDFSEVAYVSRIFAGDMQAFLSNFTGNYMQVPSMKVYRPWLLMTIIFDYGLWNTWATGYYITNLLHYIACSALIMSLVKILTGYWGQARSNCAAVFSALLFAVNPLHCESVSWMVGRVDIVCLAYYLLALNAVALYLGRQNKRWLWFACLSFWLSILTKEMSIGFPFIATLLSFLFVRNGSASETYAGSQRLRTPGLRTPGAGADLISGGSFRAGADLNGLNDCASSDANANQIEAKGGGKNVDEMLEPRRPSNAQFALAMLEAPPGSMAMPSGSLDAIRVSANHIPQATGWTDISADLKERLLPTAPVAISVFSSLVVYFVIRNLCLGTLVGGYAGSIGRTQLGAMILKWTDVDTVMRIVYPLNQFVFTDTSSIKSILSCLYVLLVSLTIARALLGSLPRRWLVFLAAMAVTAVVPIYALWGIGYNLEGARFVFFLTVPLSIIFPVFLLSPWRHAPGWRQKPGQSPLSSSGFISLNRKIMIVSVAVLAALVLVFCRLTERNNLPWIHAGKQTRAVKVKARDLAQATPAGRIAAVIGIPKRQGGGLMILNNTTFARLITPPFEKTADLPNRIMTFDSVLFGDDNHIDTQHFKEALANRKVTGFYRWDMDKLDFVSFDPGAIRAQPSQLFNVENGEGLRLMGLNASPSQFDYLALHVRIPDGLKLDGKNCKLEFGSKTGIKSDYDVTLGSEHIVESQATPEVVLVRLPLSCYWRWYGFGPIDSIAVHIDPREKVQILKAQLLPAELLAPSVNFNHLQSANDGSYVLDTTSFSPVELAVDGSRLKGSRSIEVQILKKNCFFENLSQATLNQAVERNVKVEGARVEKLALPPDVLKGDGYVQLRVRCLDDANKQVGEYCFPLTLRLL